MPRVISLLAAIALCACGRSPNVTAPQTAEQETPPAYLPFDNSTGFLDGYSLNVTNEGNLFWNSVPINDATLKDYLPGGRSAPATPVVYLSHLNRVSH